MKAENLNPIFQTLREKSKKLKDFQNLNKGISENISDHSEHKKFPFSILRSEILISPDQEKQIRNNIAKTRFSTKITGEKLINSDHGAEWVEGNIVSFNEAMNIYTLNTDNFLSLADFNNIHKDSWSLLVCALYPEIEISISITKQDIFSLQVQFMKELENEVLHEYNSGLIKLDGITNEEFEITQSTLSDVIKMTEKSDI